MEGDERNYCVFNMGVNTQMGQAPWSNHQFASLMTIPAFCPRFGRLQEEEDDYFVILTEGFLLIELGEENVRSCGCQDRKTGQSLVYYSFLRARFV